ncbi:hypothetical protein MASR2M74_02810 [Paracoccaceae bacterium]
MHPSLKLDLPDPEWILLLRSQVEKGKSISQIARETDMARPSVSMLISGTYPAQSLDLVTAKHAARVFAIYRDQVLCPFLRIGLTPDRCRSLASAPMSTSDPEQITQWRACRRCHLNPLKSEAADG